MPNPRTIKPCLDSSVYINSRRAGDRRHPRGVGGLLEQPPSNSTNVIFFQDFTWNITSNEIFKFIIIDDMFYLSMHCRETVNDSLSYLYIKMNV